MDETGELVYERDGRTVVRRFVSNVTASDNPTAEFALATVYSIVVLIAIGVVFVSFAGVRDAITSVVGVLVVVLLIVAWIIGAMRLLDACTRTGCGVEICGGPGAFADYVYTGDPSIDAERIQSLTEEAIAKVDADIENEKACCKKHGEIRKCLNEISPATTPEETQT